MSTITSNTQRVVQAVGDLLPARSGSVPSAAEETLLAEQVEQFQNRGFTVLREVLSAAEVASLRAQLRIVQVDQQLDVPVSYTHLTLPTNREV